MKLISLNTNSAASVARIRTMCDWFDSERADIFVLSEVRYNRLDRWRLALADIGFQLYAAPIEDEGLGACIATRYPGRFVPHVFDHGFADYRTVSAEIGTPVGLVDVHACYVRTESRTRGIAGSERPHVIDALVRGLADRTNPQIVAGDFNAPQFILEDETWISWARKRHSDGEYQIPHSNNEVVRAHLACPHRVVRLEC